MEILSTIKDKRINSLNFLIECTFEEYLRFAPSVIKNKGNMTAEFISDISKLSVKTIQKMAKAMGVVLA